MISFKAFSLKLLALLKAAFYRRRLLNLATVIGDLLLKKSSPTGLPFILQVEPTNRCNLKCNLCLVGIGKLKRAIGDMSFDSFKKLIRPLEDKLIYLILYNLGEPLLNKDIYKMIGYAAKRRIYVRLSTNGELYTKDLIHSGINELVISLSYTTPSNYLKHKGVDGFQRVIANLRQFSADRGKKSSPFIVLQLLVTHDTEKDIAGFRAFANSLNVDKVMVKTVRVNFHHAPAEREFLPLDKKYIRPFYLGKEKRTLCYRPWISSVIFWDGSVVSCCFSMENEYVFGNAITTDFRNIWQNNDYNLFRKNILTRDYSKSICVDCSLSGVGSDLSKLI